MQVGRARTSIRWATVGSAVVIVAAAAGCGGGVGGGPGVSASTTPAGDAYVDGNVAAKRTVRPARAGWRDVACEAAIG